MSVRAWYCMVTMATKVWLRCNWNRPLAVTAATAAAAGAAASAGAATPPPSPPSPPPPPPPASTRRVDGSVSSESSERVDAIVPCPKLENPVKTR